MLTADERRCFGTLAALMVPGGAGMPGAEALGLAGAPADEVLRIEPAWSAPLRGFLAAAEGVTDMAGLEAVARANPDGFRALEVVVANACFMHPDTREAISYPGQEARDSSTGLTPEDEALLAPVIARGPLWRAAG